MPAVESPPSPANARLRIIGAGAVIALAGLAAYHNSFSAPFFFDDREQVTGNATIRHLWNLGTVLSPRGHGAVGGRPLLNFSFAISYALGGLNVRGYHALNLLIHILAGLTLFGIVRRTPLAQASVLRPVLRSLGEGGSPGARDEGGSATTSLPWLLPLR